MLRKLFARFTSDTKSSRGNTPQWSTKTQHLTNRMDEIQILSGHTDIVRSMIRIDSSRFASASDDCTIIIWSVDTGEPLLRLVGHTLTITCMLMVSKNTLISGSADRSLIIWDLSTGKINKVIPDCHHGSIKCLIRLDSWRFMSGGNDKYLNIWKTTGELVDCIERREQENLNCLLLISNHRVVTGGNGTDIVVYSLPERRACMVLSAHRETVRCIINVNPTTFASASIDGHIALWSSVTMEKIHDFNYHKTYINDERVYTYNVHQLVRLSDHYLAACIGYGYAVYKIDKSPEIVMECLHAHSANVLAIAPLYYGTALITSSADTTIRLWSSKTEFQFRPHPSNPKSNSGPNAGGKNSQQQSSSAAARQRANSNPLDPMSTHTPQTPADPRVDVKYVPQEKTVDRRSVSNFLTSTLLDDKPSVGIHPPRLIGDMCCHSDQVNVVLPLSPFSFVSASSDGCIIIWRDGRVESAFRSEFSSLCLKQWHDTQVEISILEATSSQYASSEAKYSLTGSASMFESDLDNRIGIYKYDLSSGELSNPSSQSPSSGVLKDFSPLLTPTNHSMGNISPVSPPKPAETTSKVKVPAFISDNVYYLYYEQHYTIEQIQEQLLKDGNSAAIITAALAELQ